MEETITILCFSNHARLPKGHVELGEETQRVPIGDAFSQLAIIPILNAHENQRQNRLLGGQSAAARLRLLQAEVELLADAFHQCSILDHELQDFFQHRIEFNALTLEFQIGECNLMIGSSHVGSLIRLPVGTGPPFSRRMDIFAAIRQNRSRHDRTRAQLEKQNSEN